MKFNDFLNERYGPGRPRPKSWHEKYSPSKDKVLVTVRNMEQKIILLCEMRGQVSDGMWENSNPHDHWHWIRGLDDKTVAVGSPKVDPEVASHIAKSYNFASPSLLDIVGDRILLKINLWKKHGDKVARVLFSDHWLIPDSSSDMKRHVTSTDQYYKDKVQKLVSAGITADMIEDAEKNPVYSRKDLVKDCKELNNLINKARRI